MSFFEQNFFDAANNAEQAADSLDLSRNISEELSKVLATREGEDESSYANRVIIELKEANPQYISPAIEPILNRLIERAGEIPAEEIKYFLIALLTKTKPSEQEELITRYQEVLFDNQAVRDDIAGYMQISLALAESNPIFTNQAIEFYRSLSPAEQEIYRPQFFSAMGSANKPLLYQAALPKESRLPIDQIEALLRESSYDCVEFFINLPPEDRSEYYQVIRKTMETHPWGMGNLYRVGDCLTKEDREAFSDVIKNSFTEAERYDKKSQPGIVALLTEEQRRNFGYIIDIAVPDEKLFRFFSNLEPSDLVLHFDEFCELSRNLLAQSGESGEDDDMNYSSREEVVIVLSHLTSEIRKKYFDIYPANRLFDDLRKDGFYSDAIALYDLLEEEDRAACQESLRVLIERQLFLRVAAATGNEAAGVLNYFRYIKGTRFKNNASASQASRIYSALKSEVGEMWTAHQSLQSLLHHIENDGSIIGIDMSASQKRTAIYAGFAELGIDPMPTLSWELSPEQRDELPVVLNSLASQISSTEESALDLRGLCLPYRPREREVSGFEKSIIRWLRLLPISSMISEFDASMQKIIDDHLLKLKQLQQENHLNQVPSQPEISQLKIFAQAINDFESSVVSSACKMLGIGELSAEEFELLLTEWNYDLTPAITLATKFAFRYPEGSVLCAEFLEAEAKGQYWQKYYDLNDPIVKDQLDSLLCQVEDRQKALEDYHRGIAFVDDVVHVEKVKGTRFEPDQAVKNSMLQRFFEYGHLDQLDRLENLSGLDQEDLGTIKAFLAAGLTGEKPMNISEFKEKYSNLGETFLGEVIRVHQWLRDTASAKKTSAELERSFGQMMEKLSSEWHNLTFIVDDLAKYYLAKIAAEGVMAPGAETVSHRTLLVHTTHNPKTLMEIGHYPINSGSCQDYLSPDVRLLEHLPSYVFDANLFAIVVREVESAEKIQEIISFDEVKKTATVATADGTAEVKISHPIARSMIFMGRSKATGAPALSMAPIYDQPGKIEDAEATQYLEMGVERFRAKMETERGALFEMDQPMVIPKSHNPRGPYLDKKDITYIK